MFDTTEIKSAVERLAHGTGTSEDKQAILDALNNEQITLASGERSIALGGNVTDAVINIGHHNIIFKGDAADTLREALTAYFASKAGSAPHGHQVKIITIGI
jgi:hypothetical protein